MAAGDEDAGASVLQFRLAGSAEADPGTAVFEEMLVGFARQQRSRSLSSTTITARESHLRRFAAFCDSWPWEWQPVDVEDWTSHMRSGSRPLSKATIRGYQNAVSLFCSYLVDARYSWADRCMELFGTHPVQICHEWNTTAHLAEHEADPRVRPLTRDEVQMFFDYADDQADIALSTKRKGCATAFRDSTLFKVTYAFGLRRREVAMLDLHDFTRNPTAPEFGRFGVCNVRWGKASKGSPPRRRAVVSVFDWTAPVLRQYVDDVLPRFGLADSAVLWPTERQGRVGLQHLDERFAQWRDELGLDPSLHLHCLRHSYVTHLIEDGFDPLFVQQQVGHRWGSTTALYTGVSGDYRNRAVRKALDAALRPPGSLSKGVTDELRDEDRQL